jgi:hypothetical protein
LLLCFFASLLLCFLLLRSSSSSQSGPATRNLLQYRRSNQTLRTSRTVLRVPLPLLISFRPVPRRRARFHRPEPPPLLGT